MLLKDGTSLVIHDGKDDGMSQPAGNAGDASPVEKYQNNNRHIQRSHVDSLF